MTRWRHSVIWRFAALVFLMQIACVVVALAAVHQFTSRSVNQASREVAVSLRDDIAATYAAAGIAAAGATVRARVNADHSGASVLLLENAKGEPIAGNLPRWPAGVGTAESWRHIEARKQGQRGGEPLTIGVVTTRFPDGTRLLTGHVVENDIRFGGYLEAALLGAVLLAIPLAAAAAFLSALIIRGRLRSVIETASAVSRGAMDQRITLSGSRDMFDTLGEEINAMLDRIAALMDEMRLVTDGLAHDLRSPLTRMRAVLDHALRRTDDEAAAAALARAMEEGDALLRMLDSALLISRAEAGIGRDGFAPLDVGALLIDFQDMYDALAEESGVTIGVHASTGLRVRAHREMLGQALSNLIDNALKYGGDAIVLAARHRDGAIEIVVSDNGPGIAQERRVEALRRFSRLDASRHVSGAGLGLSLAAAVAHLHGGALTLEDAEPGLLVLLSLPDPGDRDA